MDGERRRRVLQALLDAPSLLLQLPSLLMTSADRFKDEEQLLEERLILEEMLQVVEQRDALASLLEDLELQTEQEQQKVLLSDAPGSCWS